MFTRSYGMHIIIPGSAMMPKPASRIFKIIGDVTITEGLRSKIRELGVIAVYHPIVAAWKAVVEILFP